MSSQTEIFGLGIQCAFIIVTAGLVWPHLFKKMIKANYWISDMSVVTVIFSGVRNNTILKISNEVY